jgi:mRNA interferase MazF
VFALVSRQVLIESRFSTVMCVPVYTAYDGLATQVPVGIGEGLTHESSLHCDEVVSLQKTVLTDYVGTLSPQKIAELNRALRVALDLPD